jgi:hypothetical protein
MYILGHPPLYIDAATFVDLSEWTKLYSPYSVIVLSPVN